MNTINDVIVEKLLIFMDKQNLTQYKLAMNSGLPFATIKSIMQRRTKSIDLKTVILLASGLGIHASELISGEQFLAENLDLE
ncbi:MAG: helix-turn-helix transcriptional regulator [Clostridia bacterium]|nr:helix-turn-helix transcriptional regulator [Clostridia bacterium]